VNYCISGFAGAKNFLALRLIYFLYGKKNLPFFQRKKDREIFCEKLFLCILRAYVRNLP
jgi:hypothetical protein